MSTGQVTKEQEAAPDPGSNASNHISVALLYHEDPRVRIQAIEAAAETKNTNWVDDLIRAQSVEFHPPVLGAYARGLAVLTGDNTARLRGSWKAWLAAEVEAGRLTLKFQSTDPEQVPAAQRRHIQPLASRLGLEHMTEVTAHLASPEFSSRHTYDALRYLVANDHLQPVQEFLCSDWIGRLLAKERLSSGAISLMAFYLDGLADPGPLRHCVSGQIRACLESTDTNQLINALHWLAGVDGASTLIALAGVEDRLNALTNAALPVVAMQAGRVMQNLQRLRAKPRQLPPNPPMARRDVSYEETFRDLCEKLGGEYPCFELKGIDWEAVGAELLPRASQVTTDDGFGLLCLELVARLQDSHAVLLKGAVNVPLPPLPRWSPGLACLLDDRGRPVVYHLNQAGPAERAGVRVGHTIRTVNGLPAQTVLEKTMKVISRYSGFSSERQLRYQAVRRFLLQLEKGAPVNLKVEDLESSMQSFQIAADLPSSYVSRLPVPIPGIRDSANLSWTRLSEDIGYIYVRRIRGDLIPKLDQAVQELQDIRGLIIDVRGNSGGGFDNRRALRNFALDDSREPDRPRFLGPIAVLIDSQCISAGEGWASWFAATKRARFFGETTAGASARKKVYLLKNGFYSVRYPVKPYTGFLDRIIERRGLEPDVPIQPNARDLAEGRDTVLEAAKQYLLTSPDSAL